MKKFLDKIKKSNAGFTMVELIVVVAIIAVLAVVLAPQYIKYVEKSRIAADQSTLASIEKTLNVLVADGSLVAGTVSVAADGDIADVTATGATATGNADKIEAMLSGSAKLKSTKASKAAPIEFTITISSDSASVTVAEDFKAW